MAEQHSKPSHLTIDERLRAYELLNFLNTAFHHLVVTIEAIGKEFSAVFSAERLEQLGELAKEHQSETNHYLLEKFLALELADWYLYGKVRKAREEWQTFPLDKPDKPKEPEK